LTPVGQGVRHRVLEREVGVGVVLPGGPADVPVDVGDERADRPLGDVVGLAVAAARRGEVEVGVGEDAVGGGGRAEGVAHQAQDLLDLGRTDVGLLPLEPVQEVAVGGQPLVLGRPSAQRVEPDREHLRLGEGERGRGHAEDAARPVVARGGPGRWCRRCRSGSRTRTRGCRRWRIGAAVPFSN
jgi:hypothetical protein